MGQQNCDQGTQETPRASEPRLGETGEKRVYQTQAREELVCGKTTMEEPVEGRGRTGTMRIVLKRIDRQTTDKQNG